MKDISDRVYHVGQAVTTPNGPGIVQGHMWDNGHFYLIVRHKLTDMTGKSAGICQTPLSRITALWSYDLNSL